MSNKHIPHRLKTWPAVYQEIVDGVKTHEFRKNDRGFQLGDLVRLEEFEPVGACYTGRSVTVEITAISHGPDWGIPEGWSVFSIRSQSCDPCVEEVERLRAIEKVLRGVMGGWDECRGCPSCGYSSTEHEENHARLMAAVNPQEECDSPRCRTNTCKVNESYCLRCQEKEEQ